MSVPPISSMKLEPRPLPDAYLLNCPKEVFQTMSKWIPMGLFLGIVHIGWIWGVPGNQSAFKYVLLRGAHAGLLSMAFKAPQCYYHQRKQKQNGIGTFLGGVAAGNLIGLYYKSPAMMFGIGAALGVAGFIAEWSDFKLNGPIMSMTLEERKRFWEYTMSIGGKEPLVSRAVDILDKYGDQYPKPTPFHGQ